LQNASKHDLRIDEIFGATEADHADFRFARKICRVGHLHFHLALKTYGPVMLSEALQRNVEHEARLSNISDPFPSG